MKTDAGRVKFALESQKTDAERLEIALQFASGRSPAELSKRALGELRRDIAAFLGPAIFGADGFGMLFARVFDEELDLDDLWKAARLLIGDTVDVHDHVVHLPGRDATRIRIKGGIHATTISDGEELEVWVETTSRGRRVLRIGASARASFLLNLAFLLAGDAGDKVLRCAECHRLFLRTGRQIYCRPKCRGIAVRKNITDEQKLRYRKKEYEKHGWKVGARSKESTDENNGGT